MGRSIGAVVASAMAVAIAACALASPRDEPLATTSSALALTGLFSTGVGATGTPLATGAIDPHYVLSSNDAAFPGPAALTVAANAAWTANTATSSWISIQTSTDGTANDTYTYTTTFTVVGNPATATLSGTWAADDSVKLLLNGTQVAAYPAEAYTTATAFTVAAGGPFVVGPNTLAFVTVNSGGGPTGLQVVALTGTVSGCTLDSQCTTAQFCNTQSLTCTGKLANGAGIPTITGHTPALVGMCSAAVGSAVCTSGVCDTNDNECGYANGDGPCTAASGATVCQSGACSVKGVCEPAGGCEVDADCTGGDWCDETLSMCAAQLANGQTMPSDPPHMNPTLDGTCTPAAAALVCVSGVCDPKNTECGYENGDGPCSADGGGSACQSGVCDGKDDLCGYANGDGPCSSANEGTVCRSGNCSVSGTCEPAGGCESDGDCAAGKWCDESTATCTSKLANGTAIPTDPPHMNPTLDGMCSTGAGSLVCASGVCDPKDNECSYANGDGPCNAGNAGTVCRSGACSTNGTCEPMGGCNINTDCTSPMAPDCNQTTHMCQGVPDAGVDSGAPGDSGAEAGADASAEGGADATAPDASTGDAAVTPDAASQAEAASGGQGTDAATDDPGYLEGAGLSCGVGARGLGADGSSAIGMAMAALGVAAARRRRR